MFFGLFSKPKREANYWELYKNNLYRRGDIIQLPKGYGGNARSVLVGKIRGFAADTFDITYVKPERIKLKGKSGLFETGGSYDASALVVCILLERNGKKCYIDYETMQNIYESESD